RVVGTFQSPRWAHGTKKFREPADWKVCATRRRRDGDRPRDRPRAANTLLRHRRTRTRLVQSKDVGLMPVAGSATVGTFVGKDGTVKAIRGLAGSHFLSEVSDALQHPRGLVNVVADD